MNGVVVGANGLVGSLKVQYFRELGHEITGIDLDNASEMDSAVRMADFVVVAILPLASIAELVKRISKQMRMGSLLIHSTSLENPAKPYDIDWKAVTNRDITVCHMHIHAKPVAPLARTLYGQHVSLSFQGINQGKWRHWLEGYLADSQAVIHHFKPGEHDQVTSVSQVIHMTIAAIVSEVWRHLPNDLVQIGARIGGPPCRLLISSVLRVGLGSKVASEILVNHPAAIQILDLIQQAVSTVRAMVEARKIQELSDTISGARSMIEPAELKIRDARTNQLARLEADIGKLHIKFQFPADKNVPGLLAQVLREFDQLEVDKTTTIAQKDPDGGCTFLIGVKEITDATVKAEKVVRTWE